MDRFEPNADEPDEREKKQNHHCTVQEGPAAGRLEEQLIEEAIKNIEKVDI